MKTKIPERLPISPMTLVCPFCKAEPGDDCKSSSGGNVALVHVARLEAAAKLDRKAKNARRK
jgi:hypothetical protein